jgi:hypothetical protein
MKLQVYLESFEGCFLDYEIIVFDLLCLPDAIKDLDFLLFN